MAARKLSDPCSKCNRPLKESWDELEKENKRLKRRVKKLEKEIKTLSGGPYFVKSGARHFHRADCKWLKQPNFVSLRTYATHEEAVAAGCKPCKTCKS